MENAQTLTISSSRPDERQGMDHPRTLSEHGTWDSRNIHLLPDLSAGSRSIKVGTTQDWHEMDHFLIPQLWIHGGLCPESHDEERSLVNTPGTILWDLSVSGRCFTSQCSGPEVRVTGLPYRKDRAHEFVYIDGQPVDEDAEKPLEIEGLAPSLPFIDI